MDSDNINSRGLNSQPKYSYGGGSASRFQVPDDKVEWIEDFEDYQPVEFVADVLKSTPPPIWADPADPSSIASEFNTGLRASHHGEYQVEDNRPQNPVGRTGMSNRGCLGKWGPNHAAGPLVVRYKPEDNSVLQFVAITRKDTGQLAIPGGMVEFGTSVSETLKKEFLEETQNLLEKSAAEKAELEANVADLFANPTATLYQGYLDDPRNTDHAWMETTVTLFFDADGSKTADLKLQAGDDASQVCWADMTDDLELYANHNDFVELAKNHILGGGKKGRGKLRRRAAKVGDDS